MGLQLGRLLGLQAVIALICALIAWFADGTASAQSAALGAMAGSVGAVAFVAVHGALAAAVGRQGLLQEHRQRYRRGIQPLAVLRQVCLGGLKQLRAGQHVEELHRPARLDAAANAAAMLLAIKRFFTMTQGWPRKSVKCACGNEHPTNPKPASSFLLNHLSPQASSACGLSKRHWA